MLTSSISPIVNTVSTKAGQKARGPKKNRENRPDRSGPVRFFGSNLVCFGGPVRSLQQLDQYRSLSLYMVKTRQARQYYIIRFISLLLPLLFATVQKSSPHYYPTSFWLLLFKTSTLFQSFVHHRSECSSPPSPPISAKIHLNPSIIHSIITSSTHRLPRTSSFSPKSNLGQCRAPWIPAILRAPTSSTTSSW